MNMKLYKKYLVCIGCIIIGQHTIGIAEKQSNEQEFIVKKKSKKESVAMIKEDIGQTLEDCLRQLSKNIVQQAKVQEQIFDKVKDLFAGCVDESSVFDGSTAKLKEQRQKLQIFHHRMLQQEDDLKNFLACFE